MTMAPAYTMDAFLDDVRDTFATTDDPMAQAQAVANNLKTLINTPGWLEEMLDLPEEGGYGPKSLHLEEEAGHPKPGFWLMASVQEDGRDNLPHDHGNAWVVYGVYDGSIEQTKWRWFYPGEGVDRLQLKETGQFVQDAGAVAFFLPGEIHNTRNVTGGRALVVRLESQKLDRLVRYQYNPDENTMKVMDR